MIDQQAAERQRELGELERRLLERLDRLEQAIAVKFQAHLMTLARLIEETAAQRPGQEPPPAVLATAEAKGVRGTPADASYIHDGSMEAVR